MGMLTDLVAAPSTAAEAIGRSRAPARELGGIDAKGIDIVKLATLQSMLTGEALTAVIRAYDPVVSVSDDGPWVFALPAAFVQRLAALDDPELSSTADAWARTEEFVLDRWPPENVHAILREIRAVAQRAREPGQALFLWMML